MKLIDYLAHYTKAHELCAVVKDEEIREIHYVDWEDMFLSNARTYGECEVLDDGWGNIQVRGEDDKITFVPIHYVRI